MALEMTRDAVGQWAYPVHRLDRATSGVLVFGLSSEAARAPRRSEQEYNCNDAAELDDECEWVDERGLE